MRGNYATDIIGLVASLTYGRTEVRYYYEQLGYYDQLTAQQWTRYAMYGECIKQEFDSVCPP